MGDASPLHMAVGAQNDLGGTKLLPEKWLDALRFSVKIETVFSAQIKVSSKKKKKKKGLHWNFNGFSVQIEVFSKKKKKKRSSLKLQRFIANFELSAKIRHPESFKVISQII